MGRSVGYDHHAIDTIYLGMDFDDVLDDELPDFIEDELAYLEEVIFDALAIFDDRLDVPPKDRWIDREGKVILEGRYCRVTVYQYHSLISVNIAPEYDEVDEDSEEQATTWCELVAPHLRRNLMDNFIVLNKMGTFSNGEAVFQRA